MADEERENDVYSDAVEDLEENDEISPSEEAFMEGYEGKDEQAEKEEIETAQETQEAAEDTATEESEKEE